MRNGRGRFRKNTVIILGSSIFAAAWLIFGPEVLHGWGVEGNTNDALVWGPAMAIYFAAIAGDKETLACEARALHRLFGRKNRET